MFLWKALAGRQIVVAAAATAARQADRTKSEAPTDKPAPSAADAKSANPRPA